ncbi:hypothetical protein ACIQCN_15115 [Pseudarthrobacter sp. NPDC092424]|uniref:hypothetical protein n=1 Tax=Pseudarthrobacter sp. NPDC092424 TaxID=3364415 RepID=UPI00380923A0
MEMSQHLPQVFVYADESEYKIPWKKEEARRISYVYAVGAVVVEGEDSLADLDAKLKELREEVVNDRSITNHEERFRLEESGWHLTEDQLSTAFPLWRFMGQSVGIKYHYRYVETLEKVDGPKLSRVYAVLHAALAKDLVRRYAEDYVVEFNFEEYTDLNSPFERLIQFCVDQSDGWDIQAPTVNVVKKGQSDLSSIADYMILGISRLIGQNEIACGAVFDCSGQCRGTLFNSAGPVLGHVISKSSEFRNFEYIRASISSISRVRLHTGVLS